MTTFGTRNIPTQFVAQFLSFPDITIEKEFGLILTTFPGLVTTEAGKVKNRARITRFYTRNIPTLFRVQFLSFPISMAKKCFDRILTTFPAPATTGVAKIENWAQITTFGTRNIPTQFVAQFLSFPDITVEKEFGLILTTFPGLVTTKTGKVENRARITRFYTRNIPTLFGVQFLSFPISTTNKCFGRILTTFPDPGTNGETKIENWA